MTRNTEIMYWMKNEEWYEEDTTGKYCFQVKNTAPERAKKSYEMWVEYQTRKPTV